MKGDFDDQENLIGVWVFVSEAVFDNITVECTCKDNMSLCTPSFNMQ